jgi:hypothetical protein
MPDLRSLIEEDLASSQEEDIVSDNLAGTKLFCANCIHCKLISSPAQGANQFYLRVRCAAGKWKKKMGEEKTYKYFTVTRRAIACCDSYESMGDSDEYLRDLRKSLPMKDEPYSL